MATSLGKADCRNINSLGKADRRNRKESSRSLVVTPEWIPHDESDFPKLCLELADLEEQRKSVEYELDPDEDEFTLEYLLNVIRKAWIRKAYILDGLIDSCSEHPAYCAGEFSRKGAKRDSTCWNHVPKKKVVKKYRNKFDERKIPVY
jgi:hypothetical protein